MQIARAKTLEEIAQSSAFFFAVPDYEPKLLIWKDSSTLKEVADVLSGARAVIDGIAAEDFTRETLTACLPLIVGDEAGNGPLAVARCRFRSGQLARSDRNHVRARPGGIVAPHRRGDQEDGVIVLSTVSRTAIE